MTEPSCKYTPVKDLKGFDQSNSFPFETLLLVLNTTGKTARNGSKFLSVQLGDKTGTFSITCFEDSANYSLFKKLSPNSIIKVQGQTEYYQDRFSPRINFVEQCNENELQEEELNHLTQTTDEDPQELWNELHTYISEIQHSALKQTVHNVMTEIGEKFRVSCAAISMHHAYRYGLLEHTVYMCRVCKALLPFYPEVDPSLAISGTIVHDVGKVTEYSGERIAKRTRQGRLQGHVVLGYRLVRKAGMQAKLTPNLLERLEHIVLSHQGELEWGAATKAATPEAIFVSIIDNLDAKMNMAKNALCTTPEDREFSEYIPGLEVSVLTTNPC
jgi:3'-5' exoribonuclease